MPTETARVTYSAGEGYLDRAAHMRPNAHDLLETDAARTIIIHAGRLLTNVETPGAPHLEWCRPAGVAGERVFLGMTEGLPRFAIDVSALSEDEADGAYRGSAKFVDLRSIAAELTTGEASVAATAKGITDWHKTHLFCARCGAPSAPDDGGWRRRCTSCGALHFPRTDPVVIMLILHGENVLLGRQSVWPEGLHSLLAGFMEPGETIEEAVRRETFEEAAIRVGAVKFLGCQPWPFPSNLMLGCVGVAENSDITIDPQELEAAHWVSKDDMRVILAGDHAKFMSPRKDAIARAILTDWVNGEVALP